MVNFRQLVLVASVAVAMSANAVPLDRNFSNGGTSVTIDGAISPALNKRTSKFSYLYGDPRAFDTVQLDRTGRPIGFTFGTLAQVLDAQNQDRTDERLRLNGVNDSFINIGINQSITRKSGLYGSLGVWHTPLTGALLTGDAVFYNRDYGEIILSANGLLPTGLVSTTNTYNLLDTRAGGAIIGAYRQIPNVTLQGYYAFADLPDGNPLATGLRNSYGATASYEHSFSPRNNITFNTGYSRGERRDDLAMNSVPRNRTGIMAGIDYEYYNWSFAVDGGVSKSNYHGNVIDHSKTTATGVRVGYDFSPRLSTFAFYGRQNTNTTEADGVSLTFNRLLNAAFMEGRLPVINETTLFKDIERDTYGVGVRYRYHNNLSFNGNVSHSNAKYSLVDGDFAKSKEQNYSVGVSLSF